MVPIPPSNTTRWKVTYSTANAEHSVLCRSTGALTSAGFSTFFDAFLTALEPRLYEIAIVSLQVAAAGLNVFNTVTWSGAASYGSGAEAAVFAPRQMCFLGRTSGGRRARMFLFGMSGTSPDNYRIYSADDTAISDAYDVLNTNPGVFVGIDGLATVKYNYVDVNFNSYWERAVRS